LRPIGTHPFLNVRTYVRPHAEPGIFFLAEWMTNAFSVHLGRPLFGLPYRLGRADFRDNAGGSQASRGSVCDASGATLQYEVAADPQRSFAPSAAGSLPEFLVERYTCFTSWGRWQRFFRVFHDPWEIAPADASVENSGLLELTGLWHRDASFVSAHVSPGAAGVWMGRPHFYRHAPEPFHENSADH